MAFSHSSRAPSATAALCAGSLGPVEDVIINISPAKCTDGAPSAVRTTCTPAPARPHGPARAVPGSHGFCDGQRPAPVCGGCRQGWCVCVITPAVVDVPARFGLVRQIGYGASPVG